MQVKVFNKTQIFLKVGQNSTYIRNLCGECLSLEESFGILSDMKTNMRNTGYNHHIKQGKTCRSMQC